MSDPNTFVFLETRRLARQLRLGELTTIIREGIDSLSQGEYDSEYVSAYELPQDVLKGDPNLPWSLTSSRVHSLKEAIYATGDCVSLGKVCHLAQGVTPGGGCLDVFLVRSGVASNLEAKCLRPAVEAEDIETWSIKKTDKWLIYPYDEAGNPLDFGKLDLNLSEEKANSEIDRLIVSGAVGCPKTAKYLVSHFGRLSPRIFEKKTLSDYGKNWYEYHRPRNANQLCEAPKIVSRRMTKEVEFSLDVNGVLPTDGCIAVTLRAENDIVEDLESLGMEKDEAHDTAIYYLLSILNSSITRFLLKSTADFWQGNYYQVQEGFLDSIPVKSPDTSCLKEVKKIAGLARMVTRGQDSGIAEIESLLFKLYGQELKAGEIEQFLAKRR